MTGVLIATTAELAELVAAVTSMAPAVDDADRIERIRQFEVLKAAVAAAQIDETAALAASQRATQAIAGVPTSRKGRGVAGQIGLARRCSPWQAKRYVGWATILTTELPATLAELRAGRTTEWRAMLVARETIWLSREDRAAVDAELAPQLEGWGDAQVEGAARKAAYRLDPRGSLERARSIEKDRRVSIRPAPDTMCRLTALLPVVQGVATYAALTKAADTTTAGGDERGRGQIMADTLFERVTGLATAGEVPVEIALVMTDRALLVPALAEQDGQRGEDEPAVIVDYGPIPAGLAREIARGPAAEDADSSGDSHSDTHNNAYNDAHTDADSDVIDDVDKVPKTDGARRGPRWLRRLFLHPTTGQLAAVESGRRLFTEQQQRFLRIRDERCRTPWCGAPIRQSDHVRAHDDDGPTSLVNGAGTCQACNLAKEAPGWRSGVTGDGTVLIRTPTGHVYRSRLPDPPVDPHRLSGVEWWFVEQLAAA